MTRHELHWYYGRLTKLQPATQQALTPPAGKPLIGKRLAIHA